MNGIYNITMGDRGRIVVPAEVRENANLTSQSPLVLLDCSDGLILLTREQLLARVREDLAGLDLVSELLVERRRAAECEDAP